MIPSFTVFACLFIRAFAMACFLPFGFDTSAWIKKSSLALFLSFYVTIFVPPQIECITSETIFLEILLGSFLALPVALTIECGLFFAELVDNGSGHQIAGIYDPLSSRQLSSLAIYARNIIIAILLINGCAESIFALFVKSSSIYTLGQMNFSSFLRYSPQLISDAIEFLTSCIWYYLPLAVIFIACDWGIAAAGKIIPALNMNEAGILCKSVVFCLIVILMLEQGDFSLSLVPSPLHFLQKLVR